MAKDEVKLKVVALATPTRTAIKVRELQFRPSVFASTTWGLYPGNSSDVIMEPRDNTDDLIYLNTTHYTFEIYEDDLDMTCLRITKRGE